MKVKATFQHVFEVTREVEVDDEDFARLVRHEESRERSGSDEDRIILWLNSQDIEVLAEAFPDWKTSAPLPSDFDLQYSEVTAAERVTQPRRLHVGERGPGAYYPAMSTHSSERGSV